MKFIGFLILPILSIILSSCIQQDPMPIKNYSSIERIYSINLDGSDLKLLTTGNDFTLLPNGKIIYLNNYKLYSCNSDGTDSVIITPNNLDFVGIQQYYFNSTTIYIIGYNFYYSMNLDGSGFNQLNYPSIIKNYYYKRLSPDGKKFVYVTLSGIYIVNTDGSDQRQIQDSTNAFTFDEVNFTPDGNNVAYLQEVRVGYGTDLRLYNINNKRDTSLFNGTSLNWVRSYGISMWNTLLFNNFNGINLMNLNDYNYTFLHSGEYAYFSFDSTKITFMDSNNLFYVMDLNDNSTKNIKVNLPNNVISHPLLSLDGQHIIFQADTSWEVIQKKSSNNNIVY
ncbi:MAG: TolB family protein [Ignavibacteriaceae bacterium]